MNSTRTFLVVLASACSIFAGCKEDPPQATPEPPPSAASVAPKPRINMRNPMGPLPDIDPQTLKEYRVDACYFGTLTFRQAKAAYLASLGKDEPSEKKIPNFGGAPTPPSSASALDAGAPKAALPVVSASPALSASGGDAGTPMLPRPEPLMRAPHERHARACPIAAGLATPAMPDIDKVLADYAPFAVDLAKTIGLASTYYQREDFKSDAFAKGKDLHKTLVAEFAQLDDFQTRLGDAVAAWHKDHAVDVAKLDGGQKAASLAIDTGRALLFSMAKKTELSGFKVGVDKLDAEITDLKAFGDKNAGDPYARVVGPALGAFEKAAKEAAPKLLAGGVDQEDLVKMATTFVGLLDANQRALSRALVAKGQTIPSTPPPGAEHTAPPPPPAPSASAP